ncbi:hypothetical protein V501_00235 [Pseudogymnoascus sp. VKM F-4519 (FW-2642)]|nr:hypothetical protein V501_00235 [Pseudogymnoascus sp. VKM F-4519 (FW-2642)]
MVANPLVMTWCSSADDGLSAGDVHGVEEEVSEFRDEELEGAEVVEQLDEGDEEDDGGDDVQDEPAQRQCVCVGEEFSSLACEAEQGLGEVGDEVEDVVSGLGAQDEDGEDELREHADDDGVPFDELAVLGGRPEEEDEDREAEAGDGAVGARVVLGLLAHHGADEDDGHGAQGAEGEAEAGGDHVDDALDDVPPEEGDGDHGVAGGDVEGYEADHDEEPEEEGDQPAVVVAVEDEACDPPSVGVSRRSRRACAAISRNPVRTSTFRWGGIA